LRDEDVDHARAAPGPLVRHAPLPRDDPPPGRRSVLRPLRRSAPEYQARRAQARRPLLLARVPGRRDSRAASGRQRGPGRCHQPALASPSAAWTPPRPPPQEGLSLARTRPAGNRGRSSRRSPTCVGVLRLLWALTAALLSSLRSRRELVLENLELRQQDPTLVSRRRPSRRPADRAFWVAYESPLYDLLVRGRANEKRPMGIRQGA